MFNGWLLCYKQIREKFISYVGVAHSFVLLNLNAVYELVRMYCLDIVFVFSHLITAFQLWHVCIVVK